MISDEIKRKYPFGEDKYDQLEQYADEYQKRHIKGITKVAEKHKQAIGQRSVIYLARILQKSKLLYSGFIDSISSDNLPIQYLSVRAHFETTAALGYFLYKITKYYSHEIKFEDIDIHLNKLFLGFKDPSFRKKYPECPESINVITMIDVSDKMEFSLTGRNDDKFISWTYAKLSEYCHPNSLGLSFNMRIVDKRSIWFSDNLSWCGNAEFEVPFESMLISCQTFFLFYDNCFSLLESKEKMPIIFK